MSARARASGKNKKSRIKKSEAENTSVVTAHQTDEEAYAVFSVGREKFCFNLEDILETIYDYKATALPHLPDNFVGAVKVKGESIPLLDLDHLLNEENTAPSQRPCVIVRLGAAKMGFIVDSDIEIVTSTQCILYPLPDCYSQDEMRFIAGIMRHEDDFIGILMPKEMMKILAHWEEGDEKI